MEIGSYNFDDALIESAVRDRKPALRVYRPDDTFVVPGRGSKAEVELNIDACREDDVSILRRHGGGCAVVIDPGNVVVSVVIPTEGLGKINEHFDLISAWLIDGLEKTGVEGVYRESISDLVLENRKIAGASMQRKRDYIFYSASLLVNPRVDLMERWLSHPPREPEYRKKRPHREFVGSLEELAGIKDIDAFVEELRCNLIRGMLQFPINNDRSL